MSTAGSPQPTRSSHPDEGPTKPKFDLSLAQVVGGALAAMTAAFVGSRLSMAGTIAGAALASVVAAVAGHLYTTSLRVSQERVRTVFKGRVEGSGVPATVVSVAEHDPRTTAVAPAAPGAAGDVRPPVVAASARLQWRSVVVGALAVFGLAAVALTGVELATGQALSGGDGTTITRVTEAQPVVPADDATPAATPSASSSPSSTPSPDASPSAPAAPTPPTISTAAPAPSASPSAPAAPSATTSSPLAPAAPATPSAGG